MRWDMALMGFRRKVLFTKLLFKITRFTMEIETKMAKALVRIAVIFNALASKHTKNPTFTVALYPVVNRNRLFSQNCSHV